MVKYNNNFVAQERVLLLTDLALYNFKPPVTASNCAFQRRVSLADIASVSISEVFSDGTLVVAAVVPFSVAVFMFVL